MEGTVHKGDQYLIKQIMQQKRPSLRTGSSVAPDYRQWLNIIGDIQTMKILAYRFKTKEDSFAKGWDK